MKNDASLSVIREVREGQQVIRDHILELLGWVCICTTKHNFLTTQTTAKQTTIRDSVRQQRGRQKERYQKGRGANKLPMVLCTEKTYDG